MPAALAQPTLLAQAAAVEAVESQPETADDLAAEDLSDEQLAQVATIFDTYSPQIDAAVAEYTAALEVLNNLLVPSTADLAIVDARNDVVAAEQKVSDLQFERNMALRGVLNIEQRQAINDYLRTLLGLGAPDPVAEFPQTLVGQEISSTLPSLQADGWELVVETPGYMGLNRGSEKLDLDLGRGGEILGANLQ
jgi:hypothetical protein